MRASLVRNGLASVFAGSLAGIALIFPKCPVCLAVLFGSARMFLPSLFSKILVVSLLVLALLVWKISRSLKQNACMEPCAPWSCSMHDSRAADTAVLNPTDHR